MQILIENQYVTLLARSVCVQFKFKMSSKNGRFMQLLFRMNLNYVFLKLFLLDLCFVLIKFVCLFLLTINRQL